MGKTDGNRKTTYYLFEVTKNKFRGWTSSSFIQFLDMDHSSCSTTKSIFTGQPTVEGLSLSQCQTKSGHSLFGHLILGRFDGHFGGGGLVPHHRDLRERAAADYHPLANSGHVHLPKHEARIQWHLHPAAWNYRNLLVELLAVWDRDLRVLDCCFRGKWRVFGLMVGIGARSHNDLVDSLGLHECKADEPEKRTTLDVKFR